MHPVRGKYLCDTCTGKDTQTTQLTRFQSVVDVLCTLVKVLTEGKVHDVVSLDRLVFDS